MRLLITKQPSTISYVLESDLQRIERSFANLRVTLPSAVRRLKLKFPRWDDYTVVPVDCGCGTLYTIPIHIQSGFYSCICYVAGNHFECG